jgi:hypothetical protein
MEKFHQLRTEKVLTTFHIQTKKTCTELNKLINTHDTLTDFEKTTLDLALERYDRLKYGFNEEELKMHFISAIFAVADPYIDSVCKTFFERPLAGVVNNYQMHVVADCMIASYDEGGEPVRPYFFLQEFKQKQLWGKTDPKGQMLAAMLLAQEKNADGKYLYGCFVKENNWRFGTLLGLDYCESRQFDATQIQDLLQIVYILRKLKELIATANRTESVIG